MSDALVTFALARIAEDEAAARENQKGAISMRDYEPREWALAWVGSQSWKYNTALSISASRVLADCRAKRAIVQRYIDVGKANNGTPLANGMLMAHEADVRDLVSVWEDHPDYDEDWEF